MATDIGEKGNGTEDEKNGANGFGGLILVMTIEILVMLIMV